MHAPKRPGHVKLPIVMLATIPLVLAAVSVWMVRDALTQKARPPAASAAPALTPLDASNAAAEPFSLAEPATLASPSSPRL